MPRKRERFDRSDVPRESPFRNVIGAVVCVLVLSILVKLWMMVFNRTLGRRINSTTLEATAVDSRNDVISTGVVLLCFIVVINITAHLVLRKKKEG